MLIRTSSNPIFQAPLSPASSVPPTSYPRCHISCAQSNLGSPRFNRNHRVLRRSLSDSNLQDLVLSSFPPHFQRLSEVPRSSKNLETAPSFSIYGPGSGLDLEELKEMEDLREEGDGGLVGVGDDEVGLERTATIGDLIEAVDGFDFNYGRNTDMGLIVEDAEGEDEDEEEREREREVFDPCPSPPMYLATGLGADLSPNFDDSEVAEEYYRKMVEKFPTHPLLLRNYAELLKSKGDLRGAEDYYFRATLADPEDGEILSQYAKLVWEVHHDRERAGEYFERAAQAFPHDSHVQAALASFLWETDDSESQDFAQSDDDKIGKSNSSSTHHEDGVGAGQKNGSSPTEEYYRQLVEQNPCNAMVLRNYAHFLYKSKGDLQGAEVYYSRAILADPEDGEILSQYANLVWDLYQDEGKARSYFKRSVQAAPADCHVLAAYASFLWATAEVEDEDEKEDNEDIQLPSVQTHLTSQVPALQGA